MSVTVDGLSSSPLPAERVFVTENEINGLAFPDVPDAIVLFGRGYAVDRLGDIEWLRDRDVRYWGDLDTHGFAILDRLRASLPHVGSFLMDRSTLLAHREMWVTEEDRHAGGLSRLTDAESEVFTELATDVHGVAVRLEQERIGFGWVREALGRV